MECSRKKHWCHNSIFLRENHQIVADSHWATKTTITTALKNYFKLSFNRFLCVIKNQTLTISGRFRTCQSCCCQWIVSTIFQKWLNHSLRLEASLRRHPGNTTGAPRVNPHPQLKTEIQLKISGFSLNILIDGCIGKRSTCVYTDFSCFGITSIVNNFSKSTEQKFVSCSTRYQNITNN